MYRRFPSFHNNSSRAAFPLPTTSLEDTPELDARAQQATNAVAIALIRKLGHLR